MCCWGGDWCGLVAFVALGWRLVWAVADCAVAVLICVDCGWELGFGGWVCCFVLKRKKESY